MSQPPIQPYDASDGECCDECIYFCNIEGATHYCDETERYLCDRHAYDAIFDYENHAGKYGDEKDPDPKDTQGDLKFHERN